MIRIQQENGKEIIVGVVHEKLPDFCFCCGFIGHQYRECAQYKGQPKENLAYGAWLKAIPLADRTKFQRGKDRDRSEQQRKENSGETEHTHHQHSNPRRENGSGSQQCHEITRSPSPKSKLVGEITDKPSMSQGMEPKKDQIRQKKQPEVTELEERPGRVCQREGNTIEIKNMEGKRESQTPLMGLEPQQPNSMHMNLKEVVVDSASSSKQPKSKWRRWKSQARRTTNETNKKGLNMNSKRANSIQTTPNPKSKKLKLTSPNKRPSKQVTSISPSAKLKLSWDITAMEVAEVEDVTGKEASAAAGLQPRRQQ